MVVDLTANIGARKEADQAKSKIGVLLLHGLTGMPSEMRPVAKHLKRLGYRVETPLLPGHGGTHQELLATTWRDWVSGAKVALDKLAADCEKVVVGGLSMGSSVSVMLAASDPRISGIIMMSTTLRYDAPGHSRLYLLLPLIDFFPPLGRWTYWTEKPPYGLMDQRLQRMITKSIEAAQRGENTEFGLFRTYSGSLRQMTHLVKEVKKSASKVTCPALILHSLDDSLTTVNNAIDIYKMLGSKDKNVILLNGCDHVLTLDLRKNDVASFIAQFVARTCGTASAVNQPSAVSIL
jgi:carboxylesterase